MALRGAEPNPILLGKRAIDEEGDDECQLKDRDVGLGLKGRMDYRR